MLRAGAILGAIKEQP